jgi:hypothetical protein
MDFLENISSTRYLLPIKMQKDLNTITNTLLLLISGRNATSLMAQGLSPQLSLLPWAVGSLSACSFIMVQLSVNRYYWLMYDAESLRLTFMQLDKNNMPKHSDFSKLDESWSKLESWLRVSDLSCIDSFLMQSGSGST